MGFRVAKLLRSEKALRERIRASRALGLRGSHLALEMFGSTVRRGLIG